MASIGAAASFTTGVTRRSMATLPVDTFHCSEDSRRLDDLQSWSRWALRAFDSHFMSTRQISPSCSAWGDALHHRVCSTEGKRAPVIPPHCQKLAQDSVPYGINRCVVVILFDQHFD